ncbi:hypothetical protein AcV5_007423 [Taiwanofungus camphoratus]|nr:hypothetical protein AcV5_007423 [Antrodia cinnamomea]
MASVVPPMDLSSFTVPRLKALCKERKITGYSKLSKNALIQKLTQAENADIFISAAPQSTSRDPEDFILLENSHGCINAENSVALSPSAVVAANSTVGNAMNRPYPGLGKVHVPIKTSLPVKNLPPPSLSDTLDVGSCLNTGGSSCAPSYTGNTSVLQGLSSQTSSLLHCSPFGDTEHQNGLEHLPHQLPSMITSNFNASSSDNTGVMRIYDIPIQAHITAEFPRPVPVGSACHNTLVSAVNQHNSAQKYLSGAKRPLKTFLVSLQTKKKTQDLNCENESPAAYPTSGFNMSVVPSRHQNLLSRPIVSPDIHPTSWSLAPAEVKHSQLVLSAPVRKRFKPLMVNQQTTGSGTPTMPPASENCNRNGHLISEYSMSALYYLDFVPSSTAPSLVPITLPPSLVQRKRVQRWAIILSGLSDHERRQCVLVSRMFRYAVYLSASHLLYHGYKGRRLTTDISQRYSQAMTNMWPYLRLREGESLQRRRAYERSFLADFFRSVGLPTPIAEHLWSSPDHEQQIVVALRFVLSRLCFALCLGAGAGRKDCISWLRGTVVDAQEIIKGEVWSITVASAPSTSDYLSLTKETLYVLEATCEVVGHPSTPISQASEAAPPISTNRATDAYPVRADWSVYITQHAIGPSMGSLPEPLLTRLKWANHEEYDGGISRHWLARIAKEGMPGIAKRVVAERYVLACVVGNGYALPLIMHAGQLTEPFASSISGEWMSTSEMAQDFAGLLPQISAARPASKALSVNFYLPGHHHVESVHFATSDGRPLHTALAVVQTPHREYYILRDNGMQVGCEEEGVAIVWQQILKCDRSGL